MKPQSLSEIGYLVENKRCRNRIDDRVSTLCSFWDAVPSAVLATLFLSVIVWEGFGTVLFWRAVVVVRSTGRNRDVVIPAFGSGLALMGAFVITDEICIVYDLEASHLRLFVAMLVSLLFIKLVPDERCSEKAD